MSKTPPPVGPSAQPAAVQADGPAMERRAFLVSAAVAALLGVVPQSASAGTLVRVGEGMWRDRDSAALIGRRYLESVPKEGDSTRLLDCLFGDNADRCIRSVHALRAEVAQLCSRDFASGDTVLLDGWILTRTEARVCALAALS